MWALTLFSLQSRREALYFDIDGSDIERPITQLKSLVEPECNSEHHVPAAHVHKLFMSVDLKYFRLYFKSRKSGLASWPWVLRLRCLILSVISFIWIIQRKHFRRWINIHLYVTNVYYHYTFIIGTICKLRTYKYTHVYLLSLYLKAGFEFQKLVLENCSKAVASPGKSVNVLALEFSMMLKRSICWGGSRVREAIAFSVYLRNGRSRIYGNFWTPTLYHQLWITERCFISWIQIFHL